MIIIIVSCLSLTAPVISHFKLNCDTKSVKTLDIFSTWTDFLLSGNNLWSDYLTLTLQLNQESLYTGANITDVKENQMEGETVYGKELLNYWAIILMPSLDLSLVILSRTVHISHITNPRISRNFQANQNFVIMKILFEWMIQPY